MWQSQHQTLHQTLQLTQCQHQKQSEALGHPDKAPCTGVTHCSKETVEVVWEYGQDACCPPSFEGLEIIDRILPGKDLRSPRSISKGVTGLSGR